MIEIIEIENESKVVCEINGRIKVFPNLIFIENQLKAYGWKCVGFKQVKFNELQVKIYTWKQGLNSL
jgi:hypothetical protein